MYIIKKSRIWYQKSKPCKLQSCRNSINHTTRTYIDISKDSIFFWPWGFAFGSQISFFYQIQQINKWYFPKRNLKVGDIVIIKDENFPPTLCAIRRSNFGIETDKNGFVKVDKRKSQRLFVRFINWYLLANRPFNPTWHLQPYLSTYSFAEI